VKTLVVGTRNAGKVREIQESLRGLDFECVGLPDGLPEAVEDGATFEANSCIKARFYSKLTGNWCLADDSGLEVDALGGAPGVYSARYAGESATDADNNRKLLVALQGAPTASRTARFRSVLALVGPDGSCLTTDGVCEGVILEEARGDGGFGYDPLFWMPEKGKTLAEMTLAEKNAISHRGNALASLKKILLQQGRER
jgi:XTP/dITP diphosphohydrolase